MIGGRGQHPSRRGEQVRQDGVLFSLFQPVGAAAPPDHPENGAKLRDRRQQADDDIAAPRVEALQDLRRPDVDGAERVGQAEVGQRVEQHRRGQHLAQRRSRRDGLGNGDLLLAGDHRFQRLLFVVVQPGGLIRRVVEVKPGHHAEHHRRQPLQQEQPLPALQVPQPVHRQNVAGEDRAEHHGHRHGDHKQRVGAGAVIGREPPGEVDQNPRQEARFGNTHQHAQNVERFRAGGKHGAGGGDAPHHHDPGDPAPRADLRQHDVARDPAQHVGDVKQRRGQAKHGRREAQIFAHRQPGKADVDAIEKRKDKQDKEKDDQASEQLVNGAMFNSFIIMGLQGRGRHGALQILRLVDGFIVIN